jgi:hypothetical protein
MRGVQVRVAAVWAGVTEGECWDFCVRFLRLYKACLEAKLDVTAKTVDAWLWQVPEG